ncbi:MAG TPA: hypothetical protein V6D17_22360 [Candidatus Obscuribacterales bacterium]
MSTAERRRPGRTPSGSSAMAEFGPVLIVAFLFGLFPLINMVGFGAGCATQLFLTRQCASVAGTQLTYDDALNAMRQEAQKIASSGFGKFAKLTPAGGYNNCGADLYVVMTDINTGQSSVYGPNQKPSSSINMGSSICEYRVTTRFTISPFLNLSGVPFIGSVPMIGKSSNISYCCERSAEHPEGVSTGQFIAGGGGAGSGGSTGGTLGGGGLGGLGGLGGGGLGGAGGSASGGGSGP